VGGTVKGRVDCVVGIAPNGHQEFFINIKQFFDELATATYGTIHASNFGAGASGFDFHDGGSPAGENAWFVFEWALSTERPGTTGVLGKVYTLVQWADFDTFGISPGNPGLLKGGFADGVGFQTAFREDGGDPWNGTSAADGTDTKGATVWTAGTSTLHILDYASTPGDGDHITNLENTLSPGFDVAGNVANRIQLIADEDTLIVMLDLGDNGSYNMYFAGLYIPKPDVTASYPMICISHTTLPLSTTFSYGTAGGNSTREGLLISVDAHGPKGGSFRPTTFTSQLKTTELQPNPQSPTNYDDFSLITYLNDPDKSLFGWPGCPDLIGQIYNAASNEVNSGLTRAVFGSAITATVKVSTPWGSVSAPGTGSVRTGRDF